MKKHITLVLSVLLMFVLTGCSEIPRSKLLDILSSRHSPNVCFAAAWLIARGNQSDRPIPLEQAKKGGCVTHENGDVTQGQEIFEEFFNTTKSGKTDEVRLAFYYTLDDPSGYDPEYYESVKDDYPRLSIQDLSFDGEQYTIRWYEDGEEIIENFSYIMKYEGPAESPNALYKSYTRYVLTNDDKVTWQDLMHGLFSSQLGDYIDHYSVCTDLIYE